MRVCQIVLCCAQILIASAIARPTDASSEGIVSHIPRHPVASTAVTAVGYSKHLHALEIEFVNGAIYRYLGVPSEVYRDLLAAESKARFYDENIRGKYQSLHVRAMSE